MHGGHGPMTGMRTQKSSNVNRIRTRMTIKWTRMIASFPFARTNQSTTVRSRDARFRIIDCTTETSKTKVLDNTTCTKKLECLLVGSRNLRSLLLTSGATPIAFVIQLTSGDECILHFFRALPRPFTNTF